MTSHFQTAARRAVDRSSRRRLFAGLRMAHRCLGMRRDRLGLGVRLPSGAVLPVSGSRAAPASARGVAGGRTRWAATLAGASVAALCAVGGMTLSPHQAHAVECANGGAGANPAGNDNGMATDTACGTGATTSANGGAVAAGNAAAATGQNSVAVGNRASATNVFGIAIGSTTQAGGGDATAIGNGASAAGLYSFAQGTLSRATSQDSIAIGRSSTSSGAEGVAVGEGATAGTNSFAGGLNAQASPDNAVAIGSSANASGTASVAVGRFATAGITGSNVAIGSGALARAATATGGAVSIGQANQATGDGAVAIGDPSFANGQGAIAQGFNAIANGQGAVALGSGSTAAGATIPTPAAGAVAIGNGDTVAGQGSVAIGNASTAGNAGSLAFGDAAAVQAGATRGIALGSGAIVSIANSVAIGSNAATAAAVAVPNATIGGTTYAFAGGAPAGVVSFGNGPGTERQLQNVAAGQITAASTDAVNGSQLYATNTQVTANSAAITNLNNGGGIKYFHANSTLADSAATGQDAVAIGPQAAAAGAASVVAGLGATDNGNVNATVLGSGASVAAGTAGSNVALGQGSSVTAAAVPVTGTTIGGTAYAFAGTAPAGAVSIGAAGAERQLQNVAAGQITATSTDAINGSQLFATNSQVTANSAAIANINNGQGIKYFHANSTLADSSAVGANAIAVGPQAVASGAASIAQGLGAVASGTNAIAIGRGANVTGANSAAIGDPNTVSGAGSYVIGNNNNVASNNAFVLGNGVAVQAGLDGAVVLGDGAAVRGASSVAGNPGVGVIYNAGAAAVGSGNVVSVGAVGAERQIQNVAAGAVTQTSTDAINGSQLYAVASATTALGNATAAAIGGNASYSPTTGFTGPSYTLNGSPTTYTDVVSGQQALANGAAGPVQYSTPGTPSNAVNLVGLGGPVTLGNVAPGAVNAGSTQAINGSQLFGASSSVASALGGGSRVNADGSITAPRYQVGNNSYGDVGSALTAVQNDMQNGLNGLQNSLAGLQSRVNDNFHRTNGGIAAAIATGMIRYDDRPGKVSAGAGLAGWNGELGFAGGLGATSNDGLWRLNAAFALSPDAGGHTDVGFGGGISYTFN